MVVDRVRANAIENAHHLLGEPHIQVGIDGIDAAIACGGDEGKILSGT